MTSRRHSLKAFLGLVILMATWAAHAAFPDRPVRLIVVFAAGGSTDSYARVIARELSDMWKQPVIVENHPGASGNIGLQAMLASPRDGYTYALVSSSYAFNPLLGLPQPFKDQDLTPVIELVSTSNLLVVPSSSKYNSFSDYINDARLRPGAVSYGMAGNGTTPHLAGELLKYLTKADITAIPYKGNMPMMSDVMGGQLASGITSLPDALPFLKAGRLKALAVGTPERTPQLPGVPTIIESGIPGYVSSVWWGVLTPAGVGDSIVQKVNADFNTVLRLPSVRKFFEDAGATVVGGTPQEFARFIEAERSRMGPIIKSAGIRGE